MPSLGDELLTNARLVDGGAKVIPVIIIILFFVVVLMSISCFALLTTVCRFPFSLQLCGEMGRPLRRS